MEKQIKEETKKKSIYIYTKRHDLIYAEKHDLMYKIYNFITLYLFVIVFYLI